MRAVGTAAHSRSQASSGSVDGPAVQTDYDSDNDGLIDVDSLAKLNAIRYDLDGNGVADDTDNNAAYATAFPNPASNQCDNPGTTLTTETCTGYELTASLDFDTNGTAGDRTDDTYWNGGAGWLPIAGAQNIGANEGFQATFEGNNGNDHTISNLFINRPRDYAGECAQHADTPTAHSACLERIEWAGYRIGLFGAVGDMAVIRNLTLTAVNVTGEEEVGGLAGISLGEIDDGGRDGQRDRRDNRCRRAGGLPVARQPDRQHLRRYRERHGLSYGRAGRRQHRGHHPLQRSGGHGQCQRQLQRPCRRAGGQQHRHHRRQLLHQHGERQ